MARIRGTTTWPERELAQELRSLEVRVRRNVRELPGTPDIVIDSYRVAIFVHGCFWHGCPEHYRLPETRATFWATKMQRTKRRDETARRALLSLGWKVVIVWEHEGSNFQRLAAQLVTSLLESPSRGNARRTSPRLPLKNLSTIETCLKEATPSLRKISG